MTPLDIWGEKNWDSTGDNIVIITNNKQNFTVNNRTTGVSNILPVYLTFWLIMLCILDKYFPTELSNPLCILFKKLWNYTVWNNEIPMK